jgi:hypothetical protein
MTSHGNDHGALVDHVTVRQAVGRFAAQPSQRGALDVLRECMIGDLLLDITGSDAPTAVAAFTPGSRLQIRTGTGPGGGSALYAFTGNPEIARLYPPGTRTQSLVTPAVGALELARQQDHAWLYLDPAGPTCALSAAELDFALRNPNNPALKEALARHAAGNTDRNAIAALLRGQGPLILAAVDSISGGVGVRTVTHPDSSTSVFAFTSAPEVLAFNPADAVAAMTAQDVLDGARAQGHAGIVLNPAGPSMHLSLAEIAG